MHSAIYLALDFPTWKETNTFISENELQGVPVKVGMELFYREGPVVIEWLKQNNHPIFLDLKLHDIPNTVNKAMRNLAKLGVDIVNVHGLGGSEMIQAAKEGLVAGTTQGEVPKLLAVTLLTSMDETTIKNELHIDSTLDSTVIDLAQLANNSGADGVVCSAHEAIAIKKACGQEFLTVTPGIRLSNTKTNDQKRIATPELAKASGADAIVIGRSITQAELPNKMYKQAVKEWNYVAKS